MSTHCIGSCYVDVYYAVDQRLAFSYLLKLHGNIWQIMISILAFVSNFTHTASLQHYWVASRQRAGWLTVRRLLREVMQS